MKADVELLKTRNSLDDSVDALESQNRLKQLVITQIPYLQGKNLMNAIQKMSVKLKCSITAANDIDSVFRVKKSFLQKRLFLLLIQEVTSKT